MGYEIDVKSTTQILRGKLERALRQESPARDLFDIAVAHHTDPDALAHAANMLDEEEVRHIKAHWKTNSHRLEQEASDKLADINPEYEAERRQLVDRATRRLQGALYQAVQIDATRSGLRVETRTTGRAPRVMRINSADVAATLNRTGMNEFLDRDCAGGLRKVLTKAAAARAIGNEKTTVLAWTRPARRREPSEKTRVGQGPRLAGRGPRSGGAAAGTTNTRRNDEKSKLDATSTAEKTAPQRATSADVRIGKRLGRPASAWRTGGARDRCPVPSFHPVRAARTRRFNRLNLSRRPTS